MSISLEDVKAHLNITNSADDNLISDKIAVATTFVETYTGESLGSAPPSPLLEAIKMLAAHLYENREATLAGATTHNLPFGVWDLITPYRAWSF
jgi:uncharacterized phage protein (predicted DNA packaging)